MNRVFVSSTYQDLIEHRKAVTDVLTRMKQEHSAMEFFGSRADEARPVCETEINEASYLVGRFMPGVMAGCHQGLRDRLQRWNLTMQCRLARSVYATPYLKITLGCLR